MYKAFPEGGKWNLDLVKNLCLMRNFLKFIKVLSLFFKYLSNTIPKFIKIALLLTKASSNSYSNNRFHDLPPMANQKFIYFEWMDFIIGATKIKSL